jgi:hypothetical protein
MRYAGWIAYANAIAAILNFVTLMLFFSLEAPQAAANPQGSFAWGTINDILGCLAMLPMLVLALIFYQMQRERALQLSLFGLLTGAAGMLGVALLQLLLILKVIPFEQEVGPVVIANGVVGAWLIVVNHIARTRRIWGARPAWLGIVVGACFMSAPLLFSALGGAEFMSMMMSNTLLLTVSVLVFSFMYIGFPLWAFWLGRVFTGSGSESRTTSTVQRARA